MPQVESIYETMIRDSEGLEGETMNPSKDTGDQVIQSTESTNMSSSLQKEKELSWFYKDTEIYLPEKHNFVWGLDC